MTTFDEQSFGKERRRYLRQNASMAEVELWRVVRGKQILNIKFRRQHAVGKYIIDFYAPSIKLAIEVDGRLHETAMAKQYDESRTRYLKTRGITVIRFLNRDVYHEIEEVIERIKSVSVSLQSHPLPLGGVRGGSHHP